MTTIVISDNTGADYSGTVDAEMQLSTTGTNTGSGADLYSHFYAPGNERFSLVRFTLPGALSGATVTSATLSLYSNGNTVGTKAHDINLISRLWSESQVTWDEYTTGNAWTSGGAKGAGTDFVSSASASQTVSGTGYKDFTAAQVATDVQNAIAGGTVSWVVRPSDLVTSDTGNYSAFASSESTDGQRPKLTIVYTAGGGGGGVLPKMIQLSN